MKVHKYVLKRLLKDECERLILQYRSKPLEGVKRVLAANKVKFESFSENEIIIAVGEKKLIVKQED